MSYWSDFVAESERAALIMAPIILEASTIDVDLVDAMAESALSNYLLSRSGLSENDLQSSYLREGVNGDSRDASANETIAQVLHEGLIAEIGARMVVVISDANGWE